MLGGEGFFDSFLSDEIVTFPNLSTLRIQLDDIMTSTETLPRILHRSPNLQDLKVQFPVNCQHYNNVDTPRVPSLLRLQNL